MGYSTGHWEDDTLAVQSLDERTLLDTGGHPHTEALRITERFHRRDFGHMDIKGTFNDSSLYAKPLTVLVQMQYVADDELIEYICRENERDYAHIGKASDEGQHVEPEVLSRYVDKYVIGAPGERNYVELSLTLTDDELWIGRTPWIRGKDSQRLIPIS